MLLPALGAARAKARDVLCKSRLHQLMVVAKIYENDFHYLLPSYISQSVTTDWWRGTAGPVMLAQCKYLPSRVVGRPDDWGLGPRSTASWVNGTCRKQSIYLCPSKIFYGKHTVRILGGNSSQPPDGGWTPWALERRDGDDIGSGDIGLPWSGAWSIPHSYAIVYCERRDPAPGDHYHPIRKLAKDRPPSRKVVFIEAHQNFCNRAEVMWWWQHSLYNWTWQYSFPHGAGRMGNRANWTAYDGHVDSVRRDLAGRGSATLPGDLPFVF